jgi:hypothetical protein
MSRILRPGQTDSSGDPAARLVRFSSRHDAERDLARVQSGNPGRGRNELTPWRQDRRDGHEVLLLDIRGAQRVFEGGEQVAVNADAAGQEYALWNGKHSPPAAKLPLAIATDRAVSAKDIVSAIADFHD